MHQNVFEMQEIAQNVGFCSVKDFESKISHNW